MCGGKEELTLQKPKQEEIKLDIRQELTSVQHWNDVEGESAYQKRSSYAQRLIRQEQEENAALVAHVMESYQVEEADQAAAGTPQAALKPAKKSFKKRREEKKRAKEARKHTPVGDHVSWAARRDLQQRIEKRNNSRGPLEQEILQSGVDGRVVNTFIQGHRTNKRGEPLNPEEQEIKQQDETVIRDYISKDLERRRPHLERMTEKMLSFRMTMDMFTDEYLETHAAELKALGDQMTYFQNIMNDPINVPFFEALPPLQKKLLEARWKSQYAAFGSMLVNRLAMKGVDLDSGDYCGESMQTEMALQLHQPMMARLQESIETCRRQEEEAYREQLEREMEAARETLIQEYDLDAEEVRAKGFQFTSRYQAGYVFQEMETYRSMIENAPVTFAAHQELLKHLYQQLYRQYDALSDLVLESNAAQEVSRRYFDAQGDMRQVAQLAVAMEEDLHIQREMLMQQINGTADAIKFYMQDKKLSERAGKTLERAGWLQDAVRLQEERETERAAGDLFAQAEAQYDAERMKEAERYTKFPNAYTVQLYHGREKEEMAFSVRANVSEQTMKRKVEQDSEAKMPPMHLRRAFWSLLPTIEKDEDGQYRQEDIRKVEQMTEDFFYGSEETRNAVLDVFVQEICAMQFTSEMFTPGYIRNHPEEMMGVERKLRMMGNLEQEYPAYFAALPAETLELWHTVQAFPNLCSFWVSTTYGLSGLGTTKSVLIGEEPLPEEDYLEMRETQEEVIQHALLLWRTAKAAVQT